MQKQNRFKRNDDVQVMQLRIPNQKAHLLKIQAAKLGLSLNLLMNQVIDQVLQDKVRIQV